MHVIVFNILFGGGVEAFIFIFVAYLIDAWLANKQQTPLKASPQLAFLAFFNKPNLLYILICI